MSTAGVSFDSRSGFPELKYLWFTGKSWDETDLTSFRYCCHNSPKLEEIHLHGSFESGDVFESVVKSIGPLVNRTALRKLDIEIEDYREEPEEINESLMSLFNCPGKKPNLEKLIFHPNFSLPPIYQFVNENKKLKSLELYGETNEKETAISDLIKILTCDNGLQEIQLGGRLDTIIGDNLAKKYTYGRKIEREEFPKMAEDLRNFDPRSLESSRRLPFTPEYFEYPRKTFL